MKSLTKLADELALDFSMLFDDSYPSLARNQWVYHLIACVTEFGQSKTGIHGEIK